MVLRRRRAQCYSTQPEIGNRKADDDDDAEKTFLRMKRHLNLTEKILKILHVFLHESCSVGWVANARSETQ